MSELSLYVRTGRFVRRTLLALQHGLPFWSDRSGRTKSLNLVPNHRSSNSGFPPRRSLTVGHTQNLAMSLHFFTLCPSTSALGARYRCRNPSNTLQALSGLCHSTQLLSDKANVVVAPLSPIHCRLGTIHPCQRRPWRVPDRTSVWSNDIAHFLCFCRLL